MSEMTIIEKNDAEQIHVRLAENSGRRYVDLRVHFRADDGDWRPTKKGVTLNPIKLPELITGLQRIEAEAQSLGLLADVGRASTRVTDGVSAMRAA